MLRQRTALPWATRDSILKNRHPTVVLACAVAAAPPIAAVLVLLAVYQAHPTTAVEQLLDAAEVIASITANALVVLGLWAAVIRPWMMRVEAQNERVEELLTEILRRDRDRARHAADIAVDIRDTIEELHRR